MISKSKRLELIGISKTYPGCKANDDIHLSLNKGEIHALLGENGAGKSTLMKIIYGVIAADQGEIFFNSKRVEISEPADARELGIGMVFQHFSLFETLSVAENIALALGKQAGDRKTLNQRIESISANYGIPVKADQLVANLSTGERQRVEIVRCLIQDIQLLILDEPTSVLTPQEVETLFITLKKLATEGCSILFISHKLDEVKALCDAATILRGGKVTGACDPKQASTANIAKLMVGDDTEISTQYPRKQSETPFLLVQNLSTKALHTFDIPLKNLNFSINAGEILGIAGVAGNGQEQLLMALSGETTAKTQSLRINQQFIDHLDPKQRRALGVGYVPEDRLGRAAIAEMSLEENALLTAYQNGLVKNGCIQLDQVNALAEEIIRDYQVKTKGPLAEAQSLSGGNLQKFIIGREIEQKPKLLLAAHPTWGVDIGAQIAIHKALIKLRDQGCAILIVSEDLDELFQISDRLGAICHGELSPILPTDEVSVAQLGCWMAGQFDTQDDVIDQHHQENHYA